MEAIIRRRTLVRVIFNQTPLIAVLGLSAFLRFFHLQADGLCFDTTSSIADASQNTFGGVIHAVKSDLPRMTSSSGR